MDSNPRVGFIGLGAMGAAMARNLAAAELLTAVWNRSPDKAAALATETGCQHADSPAALASLCDVVMLCVSADEDVLAMVDALLPRLRAGQIIIDCSTVSMQTAEAAARRVAEQGAEFLDAPISGGTEGAKHGTLTFMIGGAQAAFDKALPVFQAMGSRIQLMGGIGAGQATKAVNQVLCAGINQAVCEAMHFAEALDLPLDDVVDVVGSGAAGNWFINHRGKSMTRGEYPPGFKMALHHKDLKICEAMADKAGVAIPLSVQTRQDYEPLIEAGHGGDDISALYQRDCE